MTSMKHGTKMEAVPMPWTTRPSVHIQRVLQNKTIHDVIYRFGYVNVSACCSRELWYDVCNWETV